MTDPLAQPLELPCGATLPNRIAKAAMTEGLADALLRATGRHERIYRLWSEGGAGLLLTGNVQVDARILERPGNVAIDVTRGGDSPEARERLKRWAAAGTTGGNHLWMQIAHAGWQSPRYVTAHPVGPSEVPLRLLGNYARPRALREEEIPELVHRFARVAAIARDCGFTGVQIHGAHGYLISSFLSPYTNRRTDAWGGTLENRARFLLEIVRAVRAAVGADFPVAVKLNSDDFRKGGFSHEDCLRVVERLNGTGIDLLEVSGGTYEQPRLLGATGRAGSAVPMRESTKRREAYFLEYALSIRRIAKMPVMLTGGFRTRGGMAEALREGACDVIGIARPFCTQPDFPRRLLAGEIGELSHDERTLVLSHRRWLSPASPILLLKIINVLGGQAWFYEQIFRLADGRPLHLKMGVLESFLRYWWSELTTAMRMRRARRAPRTAAS